MPAFGQSHHLALLSSFDRRNFVALGLYARDHKKLILAQVTGGGRRREKPRLTSAAERLVNHRSCKNKNQIKKLDASRVFEAFGREMRFDKILVDAPCSGIGLIRREPDIKATIKTMLTLNTLQVIQLENIGWSLSKVWKNECNSL